MQSVTSAVNVTRAAIGRVLCAASQLLDFRRDDVITGAAIGEHAQFMSSPAVHPSKQ